MHRRAYKAASLADKRSHAHRISYSHNRLSRCAYVLEHGYFNNLRRRHYNGFAFRRALQVRQQCPAVYPAYRAQYFFLFFHTDAHFQYRFILYYFTVSHYFFQALLLSLRILHRQKRSKEVWYNSKTTAAPAVVKK